VRLGFIKPSTNRESHRDQHDASQNVFSQYEELQSEMDANGCGHRCKVPPMPMGQFGY
jgi:hypothetical protein